jgi:sugar-specific transcriptional regulator TrmB
VKLLTDWIISHYQILAPKNNPSKVMRQETTKISKIIKELKKNSPNGIEITITLDFLEEILRRFEEEIRKGIKIIK